MRMKSIYSRAFTYGGMLVQPQAEFSVKSARDAKVLAVARRAALLAAPPPPAAPPPAVVAATKRSYKRRDMVAETAAAPAPGTGVPDMSLLTHVGPANSAPEAWQAPGPAQGFDADLDDTPPQARDDDAER